VGVPGFMGVPGKETIAQVLKFDPHLPWVTAATPLYTGKKTGANDT